MLDITIGMIVLMITLSLLLSIILIVKRNPHQIETCNHFYLSIQLNQIQSDQHEKWNLQKANFISLSNYTIEIKDNGDIVKSSKDGGYEYLGTCPRTYFKKEGEESYVVFQGAKKEDEECYPLNKRTH